jgi:hypothetical protein
MIIYTRFTLIFPVTKLDSVTPMFIHKFNCKFTTEHLLLQRINEAFNTFQYAQITHQNLSNLQLRPFVPVSEAQKRSASIFPHTTD